MRFLSRPRGDVIAHFLDEQRSLSFTYPEVGATRGELPAGYAIDRNRQHLGSGDDVYRRACDALRAWKMFPAWTAIEPHVPIEEGRVLAVLVHAGLWFLNSARIVYVIDEPRRFGFAYGTLPGHAECGEERFSVERLDDGAVWYDVRAFSKPRYWGARALYPVTRMLQRRFGRDSKAAMRGAVAP
jgi:uncharacterized protein (UPF0548 family)